MRYRRSVEAKGLVEGVAAEHHPHVLAVGLEVVLLEKTPTSKGRAVWGRAKKVSGLPAFLVATARDGGGTDYEEQPEDFFVAEFSEGIWEMLSPSGRAALADHVLSQMQVEEDEETGDVSLAVVSPPVAEFADVIERRGLWREDLRQMVAQGAQQLSLDDENLDVEITHGGRTVRTSTATIQRLPGLAGATVDPETGEVLEGARS
jgi:hypothetical protein